ncbi:hypothetical protein JTB14_012121 [Gonioctena quinquepunctata]|nr:hypothetical protein JTB14_012121 [Gonioctena quinquepunctata]
MGECSPSQAISSIEDCDWSTDGEQVVPRLISFLRRAQKLVFASVKDFVTQRTVVVTCSKLCYPANVPVSIMERHSYLIQYLS